MGPAPAGLGQVVVPVLGLAGLANQLTPLLQPSGPEARRQAGSLGRVAGPGGGAGIEPIPQCPIELLRHDAALLEPGFGFRTEN